MSKLRVLIVDDERTVADSLCLIFQRYGFHAVVAYTSNEGLERARSFLPELLLTDLSMPGMGGLMMASMIASEQPACRVLMLTGDYSSLEEVHATGHCFFRRHAILMKPIHPDILLQEAHQLLHPVNSGLPFALPLQ